jgi:GalNAc-alpha-(1->4)-GalNAc-alpha-(1->3)-diNAcBac-PP-undecaprenol alpha-1,4-N-acetyl-D-galactosaminyltransferase
MRLLLVIDSLAWGGSQRQMANLAVGLQQRGHEVHLFQYFPHFDHYRHLVADAGVKLVDFEKRRKFDPGVLIALVREMRRERYDAVVAFLAGPSAFAVVASKLAGGVPIVVSERGSFRAGALPLFARLQRLTHRLATHVTTNSHHHTERMLQEFPYLAGRISTIWNGIDTESFKPRAIDADGDRPLRLLGVGTVVPIKDIETLARALVVLAQRGGPPMEVAWAGNILDSPASQGVVASVDRLLGAAGIGDRWTWLGLQRDVASLLGNCDALVHPSAREGLPNAVCEALACGRPVIAARAADHARLLGDRERGLLFETGNAESLADALEVLSKLGPEARADMGARARAFAESELSQGTCIDHYEALLTRIAATGRPAA